VDNLNTNLVVVKHNAVIEAGYRLSIYENRILLTCIGQVDSIGTIDLNDSFTVTAQDLIDLVGLDNKNTYKQLQNATKRLMQRVVIIKLPNNETLETHWVSSAKYSPNIGTVSIKFAQDIIPYISELRRNFTKYHLNNVLLFKSNYSIRIYELLVKWGGHEKTISIDWFKQHFQLEDKYARIGNLKQKVIDVAVNERNAHSNMTLSYSQIKRGRTIVAFKFKYALKDTPHKKQTLDYYEKIYGVSNREIKAQARPGESYLDAVDRIRKQKSIDR